MFNLSLLQFKIVDISRKNHSKLEDQSENELISGSITNCIKNIDPNVDRLIDKITEMQNEVNSLGSTLSVLENAINRLGHK